MSAWRTIDSAPKDGTWIWAWRGEAKVGTWEPMVAVRWHEFDDSDCAWVWPDETYDPFHEVGRDDADQKILNNECYEDAKNFTHWMPLTEAPK